MSVLFNLPGYEVLKVSGDDDGARTVVIATALGKATCLCCGVLLRGAQFPGASADLTGHGAARVNA